jgi:tetratricopeptide (TPR) repeat protein
MRYDRDGFPIPPEFDVPVDVSADVPADAGPRPGRRRAGAGKRLLIAALIAGVVLPALLAPVAMPLIREAVVVWSLEQATFHEVQDDLPTAVSHMTRAIDWYGEDAELLCMRAMLRLENRDPAGAIADAELAAAERPTSPAPARVRALAHVVAGDPEAALEAAELAVRLSGPGDPEALNHRAYIRALVGRDLSEALSDIDAALAVRDDEPVEFLDTRGFILHLLGRQQEAIDQLNLAIDGMQRERRQAMLLAERIDRVQLARRLRWFDHSLAVMHHHRAMACQAIGLEGQAEQDFEIARQKGFDPSRGVM